MGQWIDRDVFAEEEYVLFGERLRDGLRALEKLLERPRFGVGPASLGAELELCLVDGAGRPLPVNREVLGESVDPRLTVEVDRFNLECNLRHAQLEGGVFRFLRREFETTLREVARAASLHGARVAMIGILPTLQRGDLESSAMTDSARFRALSRGIQRLRDEPFRLNIHGEDPLELEFDDVTFEGAATSLQLHLRVDPDDFARTYNAIQMATPVVLAAAANSPTFLGHRLWSETRVALFKQAVDDRGGADRSRRLARVSFGEQWVQRGALELFEEGVHEHEALIPVMSREDPIACLEAGSLPRLEEVRLHQGTVWRWNRAIYDPEAGGHLRIEMRALPAGPTVEDMLANSAFLVGLALALRSDTEQWIRGFPFDWCHDNFYRAAQAGLDAQLRWPDAPGETPRPRSARELVLELVPLARRGLRDAGVPGEEGDALLEVIEARMHSGLTGARWQTLTLDALGRRATRSEALAAMLERYLEHSASDDPVHTWPCPA